MKRKTIFVTSLFTVILLLLTGCGMKRESVSEGKCKVVTTIFPPYDFVREIAGDKVELTMLLKPGSESHTYEPSPQDILKIQQCDIFIYNGGESDEWVRQILDSIDMEGKTVMAMMDMVDPVEEETVEGMQEDEEEHTEDTEHEGKHEYDEHVWTDPANAITISEKISEALIEKDTMNKETYQKRAESYIKQLHELDQGFRSVIKAGKRKTIVVGDRFPFRYFVEAYNLKYYAAFPGCVAESEPSASTVTFLIQKVKENKIPVVFTIEMSNGKMAHTIAEGTGAKVLTFHSCHNVTADDFEAGAGYLSLMKANLINVKEALQ